MIFRKPSREDIDAELKWRLLKRERFRNRAGWGCVWIVIALLVGFFVMRIVYG
jgi:hypothetical protein